MVHVHYKHQYFKEKLKIENEKLNRIKEELTEIMSYYRHNVSRDDTTSQRCRK